jgi:drug/metabolite transporter (DMT)-like permease
MTADNPARGALLVTGAALMFASMGMLVRFASLQLAHEQVVFFRSLFGFLILVPVLLQRGVIRTLRTERLLLHIVRSLFGLAAMYCFFYAIAHLPLSNAVLLNFTAPLFIPFIAVLWLSERVTVRVAIAIVVGFIGVVFVLQPSSGLYSKAALVGLASGAFAAVAMVALRGLSSSESPLRVVAWFSITCTLVSALPVMLAWHVPPWSPLLLTAGAGLFATAGQYLLSKGYGYAPAAQIGPFTYASVVFAAVYGWYFWREVPDLLSVAGTALIVIAGVLAMRRQNSKPEPVAGMEMS